ncbi:MAG: YkgJ family cysteine cluster protein [Sulfurimicrobium sp.]|nr:YkgJ family cysteine cluster protein [Sulfurimicrobium sp.]MDP2197890.1 YkgJ family cysteine cluster protein [Sulfurimicrobium sp.]
MDRHFNCTACGKCCFGWLPLTLNDALSHAGRFPLALVWTPVPHGTRAFALSARLGATIRLRNRRQIAVLVTPTAYLPPSFPCPELSAEGLCGIHADKPLRCRTMPFYPYREEQDQADLLLPRKGWACDTSAAAPVVYHNRIILERSDFDRERLELHDQAPTMRTYADYVLKYMPWIVDSLEAIALKPGGNVITSLSSFLTAIRQIDAADVAARQLPVLKAYAARTANAPELAEYQRNYSGWAKEMEYLAGIGPSQTPG